MSQFMILPPRPDVCQVCATDHEPALPHNPQSLYYAMCFDALFGRAPTWADASAHCSLETAEAWKASLADLGHEWTAPEGAPVAHLGQSVAEAGAAQ